MPSIYNAKEILQGVHDGGDAVEVLRKLLYRNMDKGSDITSISRRRSKNSRLRTRLEL
jgi:hypothetical protein